MVSSFDEKVAVPEKGVLHRPVKLDFRELLKSVSKGAIAVKTGDIKDLPGHLIDAVAAMELGREPDELAGGLLKRAMVRAMGTLISDYWLQIRFDDETVRRALERVGEHVDDGLELIDVPLVKDLLDRPREIALLPPFVKFLGQWLEACRLEGQNAATIAARLPIYFVYALREEARSSKYDELFQHIDTHYAEAWRRERTWEAYHDWFRRDLQQPLFDESFSLAQTFIWPRAYYVERPANDDRAQHRLFDVDDAPMARQDQHRTERRNVTDLRRHLDAWMNTPNPRDTIRVISGDPGGGKSSFARMYAAHRMDLGDRVIFVPLHRITNPAGPSMLHEVESYLQELDDAPKGCLIGEHTERTILLVLDGLDELSKQGSAGASIAKDFVEKTRTAVSNRNEQGLRLRVLLSGRPIAVQDIVARIQDEEQVLHLLPLFTTPEERQPASKHYEYVGSIELLDEDQRKQWWVKFGSLGRGNHDGMPAELDSPQLVELTQQPLLTYLVALVYEDFRSQNKRLDPSISRNQIYETLLRRMIDREKTDGRGQRIRDLGLEMFTRILEEMALASWHNKDRVVSFESTRARCEANPRLRLALDAFIRSEGGGLTRLFTAFYFRRHGTQQGLVEHYEFTHKSFAEYLAARRMVSTVEHIRQRIQPSEDLDSSQWSEREALLWWLRIFGPGTITTDLLPYLRSEVELRHDKPRDQWQATLVALINAMLRQGMPCEEIGGLTFQDMKRQSRNAEEALLVLLDACARVTGAMSTITWLTPTTFGGWLKVLQAQRRDISNVAAPLCLHRLALQGQSAPMLDLFSADLSGASLIDAHLEFAMLNFVVLRNANLQAANLRNANLQAANLQDANLQDANLQDADLHTANLKRAGLHRTDFWRADLQRSDLRGANLQLAKLQDADLRGANLQRAKLQRADLKGANLQHTKLQHANLQNANLRGSDLQNANLRGAKLQHAALESANLKNANLKNANLKNANLEGANLEGANLEGANLEGANLEGANLQNTSASFHD